MQRPAVSGVSRRTIAVGVIAATCYLGAVVLVAAADRFAAIVLLVSHTFAGLLIGWAQLQRRTLARAELPGPDAPPGHRDMIIVDGGATTASPCPAAASTSAK